MKAFISEVFSFTAGGKFEKIQPIVLPKYTMVEYIGYGKDCKGAIIDEPTEKNSQQRCVSFSKINPFFFHIDRYAKPISKKFGIGAYYQDDLAKADPLVVEQFIKLAEQAKAKARQEDLARRENDRKEIENLPSLFPFLTPLSQFPKKDRQLCAIANIRTELKRTYPSIKFSVRKNNYYATYIYWTDGPTQKEVDVLVGKYEDHQTDHSGDFRDYSPSNFNHVFGGSNYIFTQREISEESSKKFQAWAKSLFLEKVQFQTESFGVFGCDTPESLARSLFKDSSIFAPFEIVRIDNTQCSNSASRYWKAQPI